MAAVVALLTVPAAASAAGFSPTGPLGTVRARAASSSDAGSALVAGGTRFSGFCLPIRSAEHYDPASSTFVPVGNMSATRCEARSVALDDGRVLVVGGLGSGIGSAELFDPATGVFSWGSALDVARGVGFTLTKLADGRVLVAGGENFDGTTDAAEIFDPNGLGFTMTAGAMTTPRSGHTATLLSDGTVLLAGGGAGFTCSPIAQSAELFDPATGLFVPLAAVPASPLWGHGAARLPDGRVLLAGGEPDCALGATLQGSAAAQIYDPATRGFTAAAPMGASHGIGLGMTTLADGRVLVAGGWSGAAPTDAGELFDPATARFSGAGAMTTPRAFHAQVALADGVVLLAGGEVDGATTAQSAELFVSPSPGVAGLMRDGTPLRGPDAARASDLPRQGSVRPLEGGGARGAPDVF